MKKKPPPGATLIARLKEQRLAREAELAARRQGGSAEPADASAPAQTAAPPENLSPVEMVAVESSDQHLAEEVVSEQIAESIANNREPESAPTIEISPEPIISVPESTQVVVRSKTSAKTQRQAEAEADLLHREIDIQDLRPTTDDYFVLTDEIRLAGRFAAVGLIAQGLRLSRLKHDEIYKNHYPTFEEYCRKEHQMSATYAYRLIRMSEMAERMAELGHSVHDNNSDSMPDPFEVMLSLGHRHLMALLPLEPETAQDLLTRGVPIVDAEYGVADERVPISRATEKQIRQALKRFSGEPGTVKVVAKKALASEKQLIPALSKLVEMLEDWSLWLGGEPPEELVTARMGRGQLLNRLAKRFRAASGKIADALEGEDAK